MSFAEGANNRTAFDGFDASGGRTGRFVITGSSSPELISSISESLAGRVAVLEMAPFTFGETQRKLTPRLAALISEQAPLEAFQELAVLQDVLQIQHDYWFRGGYPEPWLRNNPRFTTLWMQNYIRTYLNRDIQQLFPGLNREKFRLFFF